MVFRFIVKYEKVEIMKIPSFGSLMVVRLNQPGVHVPLQDEISLAFPDPKSGNGGNPSLKGYSLSDTFYHSETIDGTVYNAAKNFGRTLDDLYRKKEFKNDPKRVIFTEANFYKNPTETEKKFYLTAATDSEEDKIHRILSESARYLVVKWH